MAGIFTRKQIAAILDNADTTPEERVDQIFSLYGRAVDDGYITKQAAQAAQASALETAKAEWVKSIPIPDAKETDEYKALQSEYADYKARQAARTSADYADVKPKFFDRVYEMLDRKDGAKPVAEQLADIRKEYEEYFAAKETPPKPQFGAQLNGHMPSGESGAVAEFKKAFGYK